jgi:hypothetical protein
LDPTRDTARSETRVAVRKAVKFWLALLLALLAAAAAWRLVSAHQGEAGPAGSGAVSYIR